MYQERTRILEAKASKPERRIILIGKTGDGKSSTGNTILGKPIFRAKASSASVTAKCESRDEMVDGRKITVIDTPGIFDTNLKEEKVKSEIIQSLIECAPGVHAFIIVLKVGTYTAQEIETVDKISSYLGENLYKHSVVLFTHGEQLEGQTIKEFVKQNKKLQELVDNCGGRCHVIDNKYWNTTGNNNNRVKVKYLLETIEKMVKEKGFYTNELLNFVEEDIQNEIKCKLVINLSPEEKRKIAKENVLKKLLIRLAGVATGTLTGALFGIAAAVASVLVLLKTVCLPDKLTAIKAIATAATTKATGFAATAVAGGTTGTALSAASAGLAAQGAIAGTAEAGVVGGAGIGAAAGTGIAAGVIFGAAALAGAVGGGVAGYKATEEAESVTDAIKMAAKANYDNAKQVVKKAEQLPSDFYEEFKLFGKIKK